MTAAAQLARARRLVTQGEDEAAKQAYLGILLTDPLHCDALTELAALAYEGGFVSAARQAYRQAVRYHLDSAQAHLGYATALSDAGNVAAARVHYHAALALDPALPAAHQGLARSLAETGENADEHWRKGFVAHSVLQRRYRGTGTGIPLLLLVAAVGGNVATRQWIDNRAFAVTAIYADFFDPADPLPPHSMIVNAIGDAERCGAALENAERIVARSTAPVINPPGLIQATGRCSNSRRLGAIPGVTAPRVTTLFGAADLGFPLLLRAPGYHTGQFFVRVETPDGLEAAAASLPTGDKLAIEYLDARGPDGMARKYRVMFIGGALYPLHLAISADWKVHYFTAAMEADPRFRAEERRFLDDMKAVLGDRAMAAKDPGDAGARLCRHRLRACAGRFGVAVRGQRHDGDPPARRRSDVGLPAPRGGRCAGGLPAPAAATPAWVKPARVKPVRGIPVCVMPAGIMPTCIMPTCIMPTCIMNDTAFAEAMAHHRAGRFNEAASLYRTILEREPNHADSLHLLGLITVEHADPEAGIVLIRRVMAIEPGLAPHYNSLGHAYRRLGRPDDAVHAYLTAAQLRPESAEIHNNLATTLRDLGRHREAVVHYRQASALAPEMADIWYNLANALASTDTPAETEACYRNAIRLQPGFADALANYGRWLMAHSRFAEAEICLAEALRLTPMNAGAWNNLGIVSQELGRAEAEACYRNALMADPALADAHYNWGCLLFGQGRSDDAVASHRAALEADPAFGPARLAACMAHLPILYRSEAEIVQRRQRYAAALQDLVADDGPAIAAAIGRSQPFFLPYQGEDDRALQETYGTFACRVLAASERPARLAARPASGERIRLGIVSGFFCDHTLLKLFLEGWLTHLDRRRFEVIGFHTGRTIDAQTSRCADLCDRFVFGLPSAAAWREAIESAAPHVLVYPEVGMDPIAGRMAAMRLARVQCVAWGQPETTGLPTIDHFLSSELMEPPDGAAYYTENLVRLPNLGLCYMPEPLGPAEPGHPARDPATIGPGPDTGLDHAEVAAPVFWSGQALYKYLPQYDEVFPRIASELGACRFVFIGFAKSQAVTDAFRDRIWTAFAAAGLDAGRHVVILPPMSQRDYLDAVARADVLLDTIGWSGGKSTLDCLACNPAIVTWPGRFMRGQHTAAILKRIGCEATIADSIKQYVSIAVRLAADPAWRSDVRRAVADGKHLAFGDLDYVRALEAFLVEQVSRAA
jgi:protein O-GlcNAc transferase